jgi:hypothetical protein
VLFINHGGLTAKNFGSKRCGGWIETEFAFRFAFRESWRAEIIFGWSFCRHGVAKAPQQSGFSIFDGERKRPWRKFSERRICIGTIGLPQDRSQSWLMQN